MCWLGRHSAETRVNSTEDDSRSIDRQTSPPIRLIVWLGLLTAFSPLAIDMYLPAFPQMDRDLHAAPGRIELTLSLFLAGLAIGQYVIGPFSDRFGRRGPLLIGCGVYSLAALLCPLAPTVEWLIALRFVMGFSGDGVFLLTLAFLMKDSITSVAPVMATALLLALRWLVEVTTGPIGGWIGDRFGARRIAIANAALLVSGFVLIAADHELLGALMIVTTRGMFNTLIPVLVIERGHGTVLSSQASYSTWRDFGAAVGPLTAPWLFLAVPQTPLYAALALALGLSGYFCLVHR